ncbi:GNAT family N-acetyltransferase [bacterium]|nr:MAG: GNAT family N-acetyltransferase [bacterium]
MNNERNEKTNIKILQTVFPAAKFPPPKILEDEILKIVPLIDRDFESLFEAASDPLIWEQHPTSDRYKREVFQLYFDEAISGKTAFLIIDKSTNKVIGSTRYYDYKPENSSIAIGYTFLARPYWGGLYNKSSKKLLIDYAFQFVDKIYFHIGANNIRSQLYQRQMVAGLCGKSRVVQK